MAPAGQKAISLTDSIGTTQLTKRAAETPLDLDDHWAVGLATPAFSRGGEAKRTEFRVYSGEGGRAGVRAQGAGTGRGHLAYLTHKVGLWINS